VSRACVCACENGSSKSETRSQQEVKAFVLKYESVKQNLVSLLQYCSRHLSGQRTKTFGAFFDFSCSPS